MPSIVWKGQLTFGLVSIPVKLYRAARRERVRMHYVHQAEVSEEPADERELSDAELPIRPKEQPSEHFDALTPGTAAQRERATEPPVPVTCAFR